MRKGGVVVCGGIHMSDIPAFPYSLLWGESRLRSAANLTRSDGEAFFATAAAARVVTRTRAYALKDAIAAPDDLRHGKVNGAALLIPTNEPCRRGPDVCAA